MSFPTILLLLFSSIETRSLRSSLGGKASEENENFANIDIGLLKEKLESANLSAKTGAMRMVGLMGGELEGVVQAWENLLPDILACYASLSGG